jgi:tetratricopeptide (TPR) repeat protein
MTVQELFAQGWHHHQADQYPQAEAAFRQVVQAAPDHADAWVLLAETCLLQGKAAEAETGYRQALQLRPDLVQVHANLGVALAQQGKHAEAVPSYRTALRSQPIHIDALSNLGAALTELDQIDEAVAVLRQALRLAPTFVKALNNLGKALIAQDKYVEAEAHLREALRLHPSYSMALSNLCAAVLKQGRHEEAIGLLRQALALEPHNANTHNTLGMALKEQGKVTEAVAHLEHAIRLRKDFPEAHANLGLARMSQGRHAEAVVHLQDALKLQPDYANAHKNLAMIWLQQGNYEQGWPEYEWRWRCKEFPRLTYTQPRWDGAPLEGRTILLHTEQGLGDTIQFIRYAPLVQARGGRVLVACQRALIPLLTRCPGIDQLVPRGDPLPPFDVYVPLLSLPAVFRTTLATVPAQVPYLFADKGLVEAWGRELSDGPGFKIGIAWQGSAGYTGDRDRSTRLAYFEPLARLPGVRLFSLQKGPGTEQLAEVSARFHVVDLGARLDERSGPFMDTAAVMKHLDLVVTVDTSLGHLAGALGVPVWVAQAFAPDWRWQWGQEGSPWYPTARLFRQTEWGRWEPVFARMAEALDRTAARSQGPRRGGER